MFICWWMNCVNMQAASSWSLRETNTASQSENQYTRLHGSYLSVRKTSSIYQTCWLSSMLKHKASHLTKLILKDVLLIKFINLTVQPSVFLSPQGVINFTIFTEHFFVKLPFLAHDGNYNTRILQWSYPKMLYFCITYLLITFSFMQMTLWWLLTSLQQ